MDKPEVKPLSHQQVSSKIRKAINEEYDAFKNKFPIFKNDNTIGLGVFLLSLFIISICSIGYLYYGWSLYIVVPIIAFSMGLLHELEHDLIHWLYFKNNKFLHNLMLFTGWILKPLTINPWIRRGLHFHHHKYSGTIHDLEERGVTNGEKWSLGRLIGTPDLVIGGIKRLVKFKSDLRVHQVSITEEKINHLSRNSVLGVFPFTVLSHLIIYFLIILGIIFLGNNQHWWYIEVQKILMSQLQWIMPLFYLILLPNVIRQFSLHFITSNLHYFGDVEEGNVLEQTQILNSWWTFPFQLFCFFFGWTHAIHHFVVNENFLIRHLTRRKAQQILKENGVRFNDLGSFLRANRYHQNAKKANETYHLR